jgi:hypothetical protein
MIEWDIGLGEVKKEKEKKLPKPRAERLSQVWKRRTDDDDDGVKGLAIQ